MPKQAVIKPTVWSKIAPYAVLSLGSFLAALLLVGLLLWNADLLARLGLTGNFYYLILLPLGLAVAGFLFGALRSYARYQGSHLGGTLELGGPVVGFALVVLGGFLLPPPATNFPLTVYVHGKAGPHELVLRDKGSVLLDLGGDRRSEPIGAKGQAYFPEIPASFRGQMVNVSLDAAGYELADPDPKRRLDGTSLYLPVRKKPAHFAGDVRDEEGNPVAGANVSIAGVQATTNAIGRFEILIPGTLVQDELALQAVASGYAPEHINVVPGGNDPVVILKRRP
ncbi:MAG TPA: carboxypeptidase-like regulatory domain-containing protein [Thermoanaerobaculia bacterium]|nr:carboxypeptidase-like regulatory domain-containing protein [Thermoanaerobaculia bacterium]